MRTTLGFLVGLVFASVPLAANADLSDDYHYGQQIQQSGRERCSDQRRKGNYTREGGGSWEPEVYVDGDSVYLPRSSASCEYDWVKVSTLDKQVDTTYTDGMESNCSETRLFKKKGKDLLSFRKSNCYVGGTDGVQQVCYVPIDWSKSERKYPYCGCFDNPVPSWLNNSGYCKNASTGGFLRNLLFGK